VKTLDLSEAAAFLHMHPEEVRTRIRALGVTQFRWKLQFSLDRLEARLLAQGIE